MNTDNNRVSVYEIVTAKIIELMNEGIIPWNEPYLEGANGMPANLISGKPYRGINRWLLWHRFPSPYYLTLKQVLSLGGRVERDEFMNYNIVTFYDIKDVVNRESGETEKRFFLKYYRVYNVTQCTGLKHARLTAKSGNCVLAKPASIVKGMPNKPAIKASDASYAYYAPKTDTVHINGPKQFKTSEAYHSTLFHELVHATGHGSRLDRDLTDAIGNKTKYSREELVAEFGAAYLCELSGISKATVKNSAAYIQNWKKFLTEDPKAVVVAASKAEKACDYILNVESES